MKLGEWIIGTLALATALILSSGMCSLAVAAQEVFPEDFSTTLYRDPTYTTAHWNTGAGVIELWPFEVARAGQCYFSGFDVRGVAVAGEFAYVAASAAGLKIANISTPTSPTLKSTCDTPGIAYDVAVSRNYVFVADGTAGLQAVDVTDVAFPFIAGTCNTPGTAYGVAISGDFAYVADDDSLQVVDISDPTNSGTFKCVGRTYIRDSGNAYDLCVSGDIVYVAADDGGLQIFDVTDPLRQVSTRPMPRQATLRMWSAPTLWTASHSPPPSRSTWLSRETTPMWQGVLPGLRSLTSATRRVSALSPLTIHPAQPRV